MKVEIITTGEEVLSGQITDTNASWLSAVLQRHGLPVTWRTTVGDRREDLVSVFRDRSHVADVIIVNGGLGPTIDDLSAACMAEAAGVSLVRSEAWVKAMEDRFRLMNREMAPRNLKQADLPMGATVIPNPVGTACGIRFKFNKAIFYFTPGVPSEFKRMIELEILPDLKRTFDLQRKALLRRLHCFGIAESRLDSLLEPLNMPPGVSLGFRAHLPTLELKVMGLREDEIGLRKDMEAVVDQIRKIVGDFIICEEDHTIASYIQDLMIAKGYTLSLAESCTGGMIGSQLVDIPGSSAYFDRGYITYTNEAKRDMIGVPMATIEAHGAVSMEVARDMALGAQKTAGTSHALAVSGVAGPGGGSDEKPVGTVAFALATPDNVFAQIAQGPNWGRMNIRRVSATLVLDMLRRHLEGRSPFHDYDFFKAVTKTTT